jgi:2-oxoisovalerate dehydrogenase E1 component alpha subunit
VSVTTVASFTIRHRRFLAPGGGTTGPLPAFARDPAALLPLYRAMVRARAFDARAVALQRSGQLGTYASALGQEAVAVGVAAAMRPEDVLLPSFREHGAQLWRGVTPLELLLYWGGDERGSDFAGPREDFPVCIPVASHAPHAAGVALALQLRGEPRAAVCVLGDATSKGDFAEALNLAGVWRLPAVFVVCDNQWAISVPRAAQSAAETLAQKAVAAGIPGEQVDGNDVIAVRQALEEALERARAGGGASLVEALTYRLGDHTTADDASRYRDDEAVASAWAEEPIARLRAHLVAAKAWAKEDEERLLAACAAEIEGAVAAYLATAPQPAEAMFDHLYARLPAALAVERAEVAREAAADD